MANIGNRPTIDGQSELLEVNIFDFSRNLYGSWAKVEFIEFIRDEIKFSNIDKLKEQIAQDENLIKNLINAYI
jgi:riboflavin kinase/FMN adenylyltransferase